MELPILLKISSFSSKLHAILGDLASSEKLVAQQKSENVKLQRLLLERDQQHKEAIDSISTKMDALALEKSDVEDKQSELESRHRIELARAEETISRLESTLATRTAELDRTLLENQDLAAKLEETTQLLQSRERRSQSLDLLVASVQHNFASVQQEVRDLQSTFQQQAEMTQKVQRQHQEIFARAKDLDAALADRDMRVQRATAELDVSQGLKGRLEVENRGMRLYIQILKDAAATSKKDTTSAAMVTIENNREIYASLLEKLRKFERLAGSHQEEQEAALADLRDQVSLLTGRLVASQEGAAMATEDLLGQVARRLGHEDTVRGLQILYEESLCSRAGLLLPVVASTPRPAGPDPTPKRCAFEQPQTQSPGCLGCGSAGPPKRSRLEHTEREEEEEEQGEEAGAVLVQFPK
ncbi:hypothetical protein PAPYR_2649 [Paratrimastix pyriformis]|uniref:Cilia- and flagella-associated protein 157 n=1 Tax=Paratrimastix pyriformis TaxID=342808 RepID=A0ABQ8UPT5_9EUKA|nr:hypothetical protein PAPYR_2649 [Paratrimastix pyriformis]